MLNGKVSAHASIYQLLLFLLLLPSFLELLKFAFIIELSLSSWIVWIDSIWGTILSCVLLSSLICVFLLLFLGFRVSLSELLLFSKIVEFVIEQIVELFVVIVCANQTQGGTFLGQHFNIGASLIVAAIVLSQGALVCDSIDLSSVSCFGI